jgi:hypothetical protein
MLCAYSHKLNEYLDGGLAPSDRRELEAHLKCCAACQQDLRLLTLSVDAVRSLPDTQVPPFFATQVMARVNSGARVGRLWPGFAALITSLLVMVLVINVGILPWWYGHAGSIAVEPPLTPTAVQNEPEAGDRQVVLSNLIADYDTGIKMFGPKGGNVGLAVLDTGGWEETNKNVEPPFAPRYNQAIAWITSIAVSFLIICGVWLATRLRGT